MGRLSGCLRKAGSILLLSGITAQSVLPSVSREGVFFLGYLCFFSVNGRIIIR